MIRGAINVDFMATQELEVLFHNSITIESASVVIVRIDVQSDFVSLTFDRTQHVAAPGVSVKPGFTLKDMEKAHILKTLEEVDGNRTKAAEILGISLRGLQYKLKEYTDREF